MARIGLVASVLQVADIGVRLSDKLASFKSTAANAEDSVNFICKDIRRTSSILRELAHNLSRDHEAQICSDNTYKTIGDIMNDCWEVFDEMDKALANRLSKTQLSNGSTSFVAVSIEKAVWPFLQPKINRLWSNLDKLKSTLLLTLNVTVYARLVNNQ